MPLLLATGGCADLIGHRNDVTEQQAQQPCAQGADCDQDRDRNPDDPDQDQDRDRDRDGAGGGGN
jgi:hypothetical protein